MKTNLKFGITYKNGEEKEESNVEVDEYRGCYVNRGVWIEANTSFLYWEMSEPSFDCGQLKVITLVTED